MARPRTTTPRIPDDARAQRSLEVMRAAFLRLIGTRPLEDIAIKDICDEAGLSYPTFYRRFSGKDELLSSIASVEVRNLLNLGLAEMQSRKRGDAAKAMCDYVAGHRSLWRTLLNGGAADAMRQEFMRLSREFAETHPRINPWLPVDLAVSYVTSGIFEILSWWMKQPEDYPTVNVVTLIDALIVDATARPRSVEMEKFPA